MYKIILENYGKLILQGVGVTLLLSILGTIFGLIIALLFGSILSKKDSPFDSKLIRIKNKILKTIIKVYVNVFRGTPMIVQAVLFYYSFYQMGIRWSPLVAGLFTVTLNTSAYLSEVVRSGIESVSKDQTEGGLSIGLSNFQVFRLIILPQALKNSMASIGNELIVNVKDTSVLSVIMVVDLFNACKTAAGKYGSFTESMLIAAAIYLFLTMFLTFILSKIEKRLGAPLKPLTSSN